MHRIEQRTSTEGADCLIWVASPNPLNSIHSQAALLRDALAASLGVRVRLIHPRVRNYHEILGSALKGQLPVIWQYGGFDPQLTPWMARRTNILWVYHNITPARFFINTEPKVALGSLLGQIQLRTIPRSSQVLTCSEFNQRQLLAMGFTDVNVCANIVRQTRVSRVEKASPRSLLFIGRIAPNKRCDALIEMACTAAEMLREKLCLRLIGSGKKRCRHAARVRRRVAELTNHPYFTVEWNESPVTDAELDLAYASASLYVSAAEHEGFGLPACEAIVAGTPAVYLECGGTESVLAGYGMVAWAERTDFWRAVETLLKEPSAYQQLLRAQRAIVAGFTPPVVYGPIAKAYGNWLNRWQPAYQI